MVALATIIAVIARGRGPTLLLLLLLALIACPRRCHCCCGYRRTRAVAMSNVDSRYWAYFTSITTATAYGFIG